MNNGWGLFWRHPGNQERKPISQKLTKILRYENSIFRYRAHLGIENLNSYLLIYMFFKCRKSQEVSNRNKTKVKSVQLGKTLSFVKFGVG